MDMRYNEQSDVMCSIDNHDGRKILEIIYKICNKGSDAEVRRNKDGSYKVYEVKKKIIS
jgi:hypothetical protein